MKWGYKRAFLRCALLFIAGAVLQLASGNIDSSFLNAPWGAVIAINYIYILILFVAKADKWKWVRTLYDHYAAISSLASMVIMTLIFGLIRQDGSTTGLAGVMGFTDMDSSWPFVLLLIYFITMLGLRSMEDLWNWRKRRILPLLSHLAVFIVLAAGLFSSGGKERIRMNAALGYPVHSGFTLEGKEAHLPFIITLKDFIMEEYPPRLHLLDLSTGSSSEDFIYVEEEGMKDCLDGWEITVTESLDMAGHSDESLEYRPMEHVGAAPAVYVKARETSSGKTAEGWISCGSHIFSPVLLELDESLALVMPPREAKRFLSEITVTENGREHTYEVEVNKPAKVGSWKIYQVGYDSKRGRWSTTSVLECIHDGWYPLIQTGLWLILAIGLAMAVTSGNKGRKKEEVKK